MFKKLSKKIYPYCFAIIGGFTSFYFTINSISSNQNNKLLIIALFLLCTLFTLFFIYIIKNKLEHQLNDLIAFTLAFLFFISLIFGYNLGWIETFLFPLIVSFALIPCSLFLLKNPKHIVKSIFWLFFIGITFIIFFNFNKLASSQYCELIKKGQSDIGKCYPKNNNSIIKNILYTKINHPEILGVEIQLSKRNGENIVGKSKELYTSKTGDLNNKIEAYPKQIILLPSSNKFTMPFSTIGKNGDKNYYLGLFEINDNDKSDSLFGFYKFYKPFTHLESQYIDKNILLENTEIKDDGAINGIFQKNYETIISQKYYDSISFLEKSKDIIIKSTIEPIMYTK